jgi:hypothetical protein
MLLTAVQGIRESLGFDDMTDINFAIEAALHAAEPQLAAQLGTSFARTAVTDTFFVRRPGYEDGRHVQTEFRLSRGLVVPTPVATRAYDPGPLDTEGRVVDGVRYNLDKGIARDWMTHYESEYVRFTYEAGFDVGGSPETYDLTQVPTWLQEAAKLLAMLHLADSPTLTEANVKLEKLMLSQQLKALLSDHIRYAPMALLPM